MCDIIYDREVFMNIVRSILAVVCFVIGVLFGLSSNPSDLVYWGQILFFLGVAMIACTEMDLEFLRFMKEFGQLRLKRIP